MGNDRCTTTLQATKATPARRRAVVFWLGFFEECNHWPASAPNNAVDIVGTRLIDRTYLKLGEMVLEIF